MLNLSKITKCTATALVLGALSANINAGVIHGGTLLDQAGADQLENWLGIADSDFVNVWAGDAGIATAADFHANVDGVGPTFSIFEITFDGGATTSRIGGYTELDWGGPTGYQYDSEAFIFNLDTLEVQFQDYPQHAIYRHSSYFSTFGGGHDILGGYSILGTCHGNNYHANCDGYSYSYSYDRSQGQIAIAGDSGGASGNSGTPYSAWEIVSLEVFTMGPATSVPSPAPLTLFGLCLIALGIRRNR